MVSIAIITNAENVTRDTMKTDTLYVEPNGDLWWTPDGVGRIWQDEELGQATDIDDALDELGFETVVHLDEPTTD